MTRKEILSMPAGPAMDALVAELVMGARWCQEPLNSERRAIAAGRPYLHFGNPAGRTPVARPENFVAYADAPTYSTDIDVAWDVLEKLREKHLFLVLACDHRDGYALGEPPPCDSYDAIEIGSPAGGLHGGDLREAPRAETASLAICRAALLAVLNG